MGETYLVKESAFEIRTKARASLKGQWKKAWLTMMVYMLMIGVPTLILLALFAKPLEVPEVINYSDMNEFMELYRKAYPQSIDVYMTLVSGSLSIGICAVSLAIYRRDEYSVQTLFVGFQTFFKALVIYILLTVIVNIGMVFLIIPGIVLSMMFGQVFFIIGEESSTGIFQAFARSREIMVGNKAKFLYLNLSFVGWAMAAGFAALLIMIPMAGFLGSYMDTTDSENLMSISQLLSMAVFFPSMSLFLVYYKTALGAFYDIATGEDKKKHRNAIKGNYTIEG